MRRGATDNFPTRRLLELPFTTRLLDRWLVLGIFSACIAFPPRRAVATKPFSIRLGDASIFHRGPLGFYYYPGSMLIEKSWVWTWSFDDIEARRALDVPTS